MHNRFQIMGRWLMMLFAILSATVAEAQDVDEWQKIYSGWNINYEDRTHGNVTGYAVINSPGHMFGKIYYPGGEKSFVCNGLKLEGAKLTGSYWPYFESVNFELQLSGDGNTLSGQWTERSSKEKTPWREGQRTYDKPDEPNWYTARGRETWTRAIPRIEKITVVPLENGALDYPKMQEAWKYAAANGNLPKFALDVKGQDLPLRLERYQEYFDLKFDDPNLRFHTFEPRPKENMVRIAVWLAKDARPGRKSLTLNGARAEWDLRFANYSGEVTQPPRETTPAPTVRYVRQATSGYIAIKELSFGTPFMVEVRFSMRPEGDQRTVTLNWPGGQEYKVSVTRTKDDPKVYRSEPLTLGRPDSIETPLT